MLCFRWLPNALTISRVFLAAGMLAAGIHRAWAVAFMLFLAALTTDFLDGLAAKKLNARSHLGGELDPYADSSVVIAGLVSLSASGQLSWWFVLGVLAVGAAIGSDRILPGQKSGPLRSVAAVASLFIAWIGIGWMYAGLAFGWSWWYVLLTAGVLGGCASLKRHRIRAWLAGQP